MNTLSLSQLDVKGKKVLMRVDFNVPVSDKGQITDDSRIKAAIPSIKYVLDHGGALILMSHFGRPKGKPSKEFSLATCAKRLSELLQTPVIMAPDCIGKETKSLVDLLKPGQVILLENLRFHDAEEKPELNPNFAKELASFGDVYVDDAFGAAHRAHASIVGIPKYFPNQRAAGFLLEKEIQFLGKTLQSPKRPFYALIGGAKVSSKMGVLSALIRKVDQLLIGGGMAYTFLKALGFSIGNSLHEDDQLEAASQLLELGQKLNVPILLPKDILVASAIEEGANIQIVSIQQGVPEGFTGVDIGPQTIQLFTKVIQDAQTVFWNGPMGVFEIQAFAQGTNSMAKTIASLKATTIVGGGESVAAVEAAGLADQFSHISTGGGASLEFIEQGTLPGIKALSMRQLHSCQ